jgi:hypothetical protein
MSEKYLNAISGKHPFVTLNNNIKEELSHPKFSILGCALKILNKINNFNI